MKPAPTVAFSAEQMRNYLRHTTLRVDRYTPWPHSLYNAQLTLRQELRSTYLVPIPAMNACGGKTDSIRALLAARYWPEGLFWEVLPESLAELGALNTAWLEQLRNNQSNTLANAARRWPQLSRRSGPAAPARTICPRWSQPSPLAGQASAQPLPTSKLTQRALPNGHPHRTIQPCAARRQ